ncbi:hypothetical protein D3C73_1380880 [compost metagenome]
MLPESAQRRGVIAVKLDFFVRWAPGRHLLLQARQKTAVDVVLLAGMQQLAKILCGVADIVKRIVANIQIRIERQSGMTGGNITAAVYRSDVAVDDVTSARVLC